MKRLGIILMCVATLTLASCSLLQSGAGANAIAQTTGQTCGSALLGVPFVIGMVILRFL